MKVQLKFSVKFSRMFWYNFKIGSISTFPFVLCLSLCMIIFNNKGNVDIDPRICECCFIMIILNVQNSFAA